MTLLPAHHPLSQAISPFLQDLGQATSAGELRLERLRASRPVFRFSCTKGRAAVGKFFQGAAFLAADHSLRLEFSHYCRLTGLGLEPGHHLPRLWGRRPGLGLGLLLEAVEGPDLDHFLQYACDSGDVQPLLISLTRLAQLLAFVHTRPVGPESVDITPALAYLEKLRSRLNSQGLLTPVQNTILSFEAAAWGEIFTNFADRAVLVHGDATPTNFLFPGGRAVALDLERMKLADRLFDLSWIAGEIKHAWGWRANDLKGGEAAIGHFFEAYLTALGAGPDAAPRLFGLNPFYMALAELRICRNDYLSWTYRRRLVDEALECLAGGRRLAA